MGGCRDAVGERQVRLYGAAPEAFVEKGQLCTLTAEAATRNHMRDKQTWSNRHTTPSSVSW